MTKKSMVIFFLLLFCSVIYTQSLSQIGFIVKKALPEIETISIIYNKTPSAIKRIENEVRPAILITKKKYIIFGVEKMSDVASTINDIQKMEKVAVVVITDNTFLTPSTVQFIAQKTLENQIPVISDRSKDTLQGALLSIYMEDSKIQKHINKIIASALGLNLPESFLAECQVDAE
jgi:ABC-type uncharacterized transport system substrate-binding protein